MATSGSSLSILATSRLLQSKSLFLFQSCTQKSPCRHQALNNVESDVRGYREPQTHTPTQGGVRLNLRRAQAFHAEMLPVSPGAWRRDCQGGSRVLGTWYVQSLEVEKYMKCSGTSIVQSGQNTGGKGWGGRQVWSNAGGQGKPCGQQKLRKPLKSWGRTWQYHNCL